MDAAFVVGAPLAMACLLGSCLVGGVGRAVSERELVGWPVWTRASASLCGALAGLCVSATATSWWEFAELTALVAVLLACSITDLARRIIPNSMVAIAIMARCVYLWLKATFPGTGSMWSSNALEELETSLLGGATVLFVLVATRALWIRVRGSPRQSLGGGDAKLLSACGVYLGPIGGMACVALSCLLALACCLGAWAIGQLCGVRGPFPKAFPLAPLVLASIVILTAYRAF
jgi:Flp pilus assembly protein protease CpaA